MMDETKTKELVDIFEEAFDRQERAKLYNKEAKTMIKDWCERSEIDAKAVNEVYKSYTAYRNGKLKWGDDAEDDEFAQILVQVMDEVTK